MDQIPLLNFLQEITSTDNNLTFPLPEQLMTNHSTVSYVQQQVVYTPTKQTKNHRLQEEEAHTNLNRANLPVQTKFKLF